MLTVNRDDLQKLCKSGSTDWPAKPFFVRNGDFCYIGATDTVGLILLKRENIWNEGYDASNKVLKFLTAIDSYPHIYTNVCLAELKQFLGSPVWECTHCDDAGSGGTGKNACAFCNNRGYVGDGSTYRGGILYGIAINMNILAKYISVMDDEFVEVRVGNRLDPIAICGNDSIVLVMPLDKTLINVPVFRLIKASNKI